MGLPAAWVSPPESVLAAMGALECGSGRVPRSLWCARSVQDAAEWWTAVGLGLRLVTVGSERYRLRWPTAKGC